MAKKSKEVKFTKKEINSLQQFFLKKDYAEIDQIKAEFESYGFLYSQKKQTKILTNLNHSSFKEKIDTKNEFLDDFYFYVVKAQYKTTKNGKRYILLNVINESGFFDLRLFKDNFDIRSLRTKYIKAKIKSVIKNDFYNINIENLLIVEDKYSNNIKFQQIWIIKNIHEKGYL